jgi:hypothetical protein
MKETGSQRINRDLIECKDALQSFKSTNQTTAEEHYDTLKRQNKMDVAYDQILTKLHKIFALSEKLESFIKNPTVDQAREIQEDCIIILFYHDVPVYYPLFKTSKYFNNFGQPGRCGFTGSLNEFERTEKFLDGTETGNAVDTHPQSRLNRRRVSIAAC